MMLIIVKTTALIVGFTAATVTVETASSSHKSSYSFAKKLLHP